MKILLKILNYFFTILGVIFFLIILIGIYLFVTDPFGLKPVFSSLSASANITTDAADKTNITNSNIDKNPLLTPEQEKIVESLGIDPAKLPTVITSELENCLLQKLGAQRAAEIIKGSAPTAMDVLKAGVCLK